METDSEAWLIFVAQLPPGDSIQTLRREAVRFYCGCLVPSLSSLLGRGLRNL